MGGGGFSMEPENLALDQFVLSCAAQENPRVVFLPTASGDAEGYIEHFYWAFESLPCQPSHLSLQRREVSDLRSFLLGQEIIYVGGGNSFNMLTLWRAHGVDKILKEAWEKGIVLCGLSAGSVCWFESCLTDSFGPELQAMNDCLGFLKGSHCPHFDSEERRRPTYTQMVKEGKLPPGIAADDGVGLVYRGSDLIETVSSRSTAKAWKVDPSGTATAIEPRILDPVPRDFPAQEES